MHLLVIMTYCNGKNNVKYYEKRKRKDKTLVLCDAGIVVFFFLDVLHLYRAVLKKPVCTCFVSLPGNKTLWM